MDTTVIEMVNWGSFWQLQGLFVVMGVIGGGLALFIEQTFGMIWAHGAQVDFDTEMQEAEAMAAVEALSVPRFEMERLNVESIGDPMDCPEPHGLVVHQLPVFSIPSYMVLWPTEIVALDEEIQAMLIEESEEAEDDELFIRLCNAHPEWDRFPLLVRAA
jgi:hypothetical protein